MRLLLILFLVPNLSFAQNNPKIPREIIVTAEAYASATPEAALITVLLEETGKTATDAQNQIESTYQLLLSKLGSNSSVSIRDEKYSGGAVPEGPMTTSSVIRISRYVGIQTNSLSEISKLVDISLQSGAKAVSEVSYRVKNSNKVSSDAISLATIRAKEKAATIAKTLNVKLGPLAGVSVTEEPVGKTLRINRQQGQTLALNDQQLHVYVTTRFSIAEE